MAQTTTYIAQQCPWKINFSVDVLRLHQKWGMLSNVMDFYYNNGTFGEWYSVFEKENKEFIEIIDERERELRELENTISETFC